MSHRARARGEFLPVAAATTALVVVIGLIWRSTPEVVFIEIAAAAPVSLRVGDPAPTFCLKTPEGNQTIELAKFRGLKPVALIFGSFT